MTTRTPDPIDALRTYAPTEQSDPWSDDAVDAVHDRVSAQIALANAPTFRARHRGLTAAGAAAVLACTGVGVAAAAGSPAPNSVLRSFDNLFSDPARGPGSYALADPSTAAKVFSIAGPGDTRFEGWTATNSHGGLCVTTVFQGPGEDAPPTATTTRGGQCADADAPHGLFAEGSGNSLGPDPDDRVDFVWESGNAVRAELRVSTGRTYPIEIQNGWLGGWYGIDRIPLGASATIVAYGADGAVLRTFVAQDQTGCPDAAQPC